MTSDKYAAETNTGIDQWAPNRLSFKITRDRSCRFAAGQLARLSMHGAGENVWRDGDT